MKLYWKSTGRVALCIWLVSSVVVDAKPVNLMGKRLETSNLAPKLLALTPSTMQRSDMLLWLDAMGVQTTYLSDYELRERLESEQNRARDVLSMGGGGQERAEDCYNLYGMRAWWTQAGDTCADMLTQGANYNERLSLMQTVNEYTVSPPVCNTATLPADKMICVPVVATPPGVNWANRISSVYPETTVSAPTTIPETVKQHPTFMPSQSIQSQSTLQPEQTSQPSQSIVSQSTFQPEQTSQPTQVLTQSTFQPEQTSQPMQIPTQSTFQPEQTSQPTQIPTQSQLQPEQTTQSAQSTPSSQSATQSATSQPITRPPNAPTTLPTFIALSSIDKQSGLSCISASGCQMGERQVFETKCLDSVCSAANLYSVNVDGNHWCLSVGSDLTSVGLLPCQSKRELSDFSQQWDVSSQRLLNLGSGNCLVAQSQVSTGRCDSLSALWDVESVDGPSSLVSGDVTAWSSVPPPTNSNVNAGVIAGAVIGSLAGIAAIGGLVYWIKKRKHPEMVQVEQGLLNSSPLPSRPASISSQTSIVPTQMAVESVVGVVLDVDAVEGEPQMQEIHIDNALLSSNDGASLSRSDSKSSLQHNHIDAGIGSPLLVVKGYHGKEPDELNLAPGDVVKVIKRFEDGWVLGQDLFGTRGVFPAACL
jgi:hypothetical protein